jgi:hypothetical protein
MLSLSYALASAIKRTGSGWTPCSKSPLVAGGAQAVEGAHKVHWAANANTAGGAVQLTSPSGQNFSSRVYGLSYWDTSTGNSVWVAEITNSTGEVVGDNEVLYPNAFAGIQADIRDTYTLSGFEQNVVLNEQPPPPSSLKLNPQTTWLQVITEFFNPPNPAATTITTDGVDDDQVLNFGDLSIGQGTAFLDARGNQGRGVNVTKQWVQEDNGQVFLIEEVPYMAISNMVSTLPLHSSNGKSGKKIRRTASLKSLLQGPHGSAKRGGAMKVASARPRNAGFVIDYALISGSLTNYVFTNNTTYYVSGTLNLYGAPVFQGGTVIKFSNTLSAGLVLLDYHSNFVFNTYPYRPAVFTSVNDNAVGESLPGSTGTPTMGVATYLSAMHTANTGVLVNNARFCYAGIGFWSQNDISHVFKDCQFVECATNVGLWWDYDVTFENILSAKCNAMLAGWDINVTGEHLTVDGCDNFAIFSPDNWGVYSGGLTNCIFTATDNSITNFTTNKVTVAATGTGIYQSVGGASYYLANNSPYQNAGTTNIDRALLAELQTKTTYPPMVFSNATLSMPTTLGPFVVRDSLPPTPGYHYDCLDYAFGGCTAGGNVTFAPGTAVGWFRTSSGWYHAGQGIYLENNLVADFEGTATAPDYWVRANTAQEGSNTNWAGGYGPGGITGWATSFSQAPTAALRFTHCSVLGWAGQEGHFRDDNGYLRLVLNDCEISGSFIGGYVDSAAMTNCLCEGVGIGDVQYDPSTYFIARNCTIRGGLISTSASTSMRYCAFDAMDDFASGGASTDFDHNAYLNGSATNSATTTNFLVISNFSWVIGPLGNYYQTNTSLLINAGNVTADQMGLYHFTTITNTVGGIEIPETNSYVDLGYHYVALGANGLPMDSNGDGIPDYLEDANGNGVVDSGEIGWNLTNDLGLTVVITQPANNSQFP